MGKKRGKDEEEESSSWIPANVGRKYSRRGRNPASSIVGKERRAGEEERYDFWCEIERKG